PTWPRPSGLAGFRRRAPPRSGGVTAPTGSLPYWSGMGRRLGPGLAAVALVVVVASVGAAATARADSCRVAEFELTPTADLQIVIWIESADGTYVDTAFITRTTGSYGLGNRPGIM